MAEPVPGKETPGLLAAALWAVAGALAGFLAVAAASAEPLKLPPEALVAGLLLAAAAAALAFPAQAVTWLALGAAATAPLASPGGLPVGILILAFLPPAIVQARYADAGSRALSLLLLGLSLSAMHASLGYAGALYWLPAALTLLVLAIGLARVRLPLERAGIAVAALAALLLGYA